MNPEEQQQILTKLKTINDLIDPNEVIKLIEDVGGWIDDLDLAVIESEGQVNTLWYTYQKDEVKRTNTELNNLVKVDSVYTEFKMQQALLRRLRRYYRLLNTKLNLLTKPKGR